MGELGPGTVELHQAAGANARAAGVDRLYTFGALAEKAASAFGEGAGNYSTIDELIAALGSDLDADVTVLVKGSRTMKMERVIDALAEAQP
jgi:UDP-N-acetylmuramoyl-tripeptide--D-alanyl-D-alanine ligase